MQNRPLKSGSTDMQILSIYGEPDSLDVGAYLGNDVISVWLVCIKWYYCVLKKFDTVNTKIW